MARFGVRVQVFFVMIPSCLLSLSSKWNDLVRFICIRSVDEKDALEEFARDGLTRRSKKSHPHLVAMLLDYGGNLTDKGVKKFGLQGIDLPKITSIKQLKDVIGLLKK